jgi:hypothetical protein
VQTQSIKLRSEQDPRHQAKEGLAGERAGPVEGQVNVQPGARNAFESVTRKRDVAARINSRAVLATLADKPVGTAENEGVYLIHEWQALRDQARRMIT